MICAIQNAYPNNNCIDGENMPQFKFTFCGDYADCAQFFIYDYETHSLQFDKYHYDAGPKTEGYYNGEEIDIVNWGSSKLTQNGMYVWNAKIFERVDLSNGYYPTQFISSGKTLTCPYQEVIVAEFPVALEANYIPVTTDVDISAPCYLLRTFDEGETYSAMAVSEIDNTVKGAGTTECIIKTASKYKYVPDVGDTLYVAKHRTADGIKVSGNNNVIFIEPNLDIDTGNHKVNNSSEDIPNTFIKINNAYYGITDYKPKTGILILDRVVSVEPDTPYEIVSCCYHTPDYFFTTKAIPVVVPTADFVGGYIKFNATITNSALYSVKYYYWKVYRNGELINTSEKIYSGRLEYLFREIDDLNEFEAEITVVTQDNVMVTSERIHFEYHSETEAINNLTASFDEARCAVVLSWSNILSPAGYIVIREEDGKPVFQQEIKGVATRYYDYACANLSHYKYRIIPKSETGVYAQKSIEVDVSFEDFWIYFLKEEPFVRQDAFVSDTRVFYNYMYGDRMYNVISRWRVELNPELGDITHNIIRNVENTYKGKPAVTYGNMDYDSFRLKFMLGSLTCLDEWSGYDKRKFDEWKRNINEQFPVMIKDTKGNVWFGAITSHTFNIDYEAADIQPYTITVDFSQTRDMKKTRVLSS